MKRWVLVAALLVPVTLWAGVAFAQGFGQPTGVQVTDEKAKELAQQYADRYLKGFTAQLVLPFNGRQGARYAVEFKGPTGETKTLVVGPRGNVKPVMVSDREATMGPGHRGMAPGMMGRGPRWSQDHGMGYGPRWAHRGPEWSGGPGTGSGQGMMGSRWNSGGPAMPGGPGSAGAVVTDEKAKALAQQYADQYLKGFTVQNLLPFAGRQGQRYAIELKDAQGAVRTLVVGPRGNVRLGPTG